MSGSADDRDMLAAEYVLGTLEPDVADYVAARVASDQAWRNEVDAWQRWLAPLAGLATPVPPPPALWSRLAGSIESEAPRRALRSRDPLWRWAAIGSMALAAGLAAFLVVSRPATPVAALVPTGSQAAVFVVSRTQGGALLVRPLATVSVAEGKDLELWSLPQGASRPVALGILPARGGRIGATPGGPAQLLVSLEPSGGSPTGQPTGPVLYAGAVGTPKAVSATAK